MLLSQLIQAVHDLQLPPWARVKTRPCTLPQEKAPSSCQTSGLRLGLTQHPKKQLKKSQPTHPFQQSSCSPVPLSRHFFRKKRHPVTSFKKKTSSERGVAYDHIPRSTPAGTLGCHGKITVFSASILVPFAIRQHLGDS